MVLPAQPERRRAVREDQRAMSSQIRIPCVIMRGGTSRGPFFLASDLPADPARRDVLLLSAMGAGTDLGIDGIGGGSPLTNKVAILGPATVPWADVDYLFAQDTGARRHRRHVRKLRQHAGRC